MQRFYCLDTNVLIEGWTKHYSIHRCPDYWEILDRLAAEGKIFCTMEVKREIEKQHDDLFKWVSERPHLFRELTEEVFARLSEVFETQSHRRLVDSAKFRSSADPWVIAHAMADSAVVVTKEGFETKATKRVKIPNVCDALGVPWVDEFQFLDEIGIRFSAILRG